MIGLLMHPDHITDLPQGALDLGSVRLLGVNRDGIIAAKDREQTVVAADITIEHSGPGADLTSV